MRLLWTALALAAPRAAAAVPVAAAAGAAAQDMSAAATSAAQIAVETGMMMGAYYGDKRTPLERTIEARERFRERLGELSREQRQVEGPWLEGLINDATDKIKRLRAEEKANSGDGDLPTVGAFITAEQP